MSCAEEHVQNAARAVLDELGSLMLDQARASGCPLPDGDPGLLWCHPPNEALNREEKYDPRKTDREREAKRRESMLFGSFLVGQGVKGGVPDVIIFEAPPAQPGARGVALELKSEVGKVQPNQQAWLRALHHRGWVTAAPRGTAALLDALRGLGWPVDEALARLAARGETIDETGALRVDAAKAKRWAQAQRAQRAGSTT